jgi:Zn-dependent membrane protease YugP
MPHFGFFDPMYFLWVAPALILVVWAQFRVKSAYAAAQQVAAPLSGAAAARHVLDSAGLQDVSIEQVDGFMTDHYDPRDKVLRLSPQVYQSRSLAAVGIAAHEAGHALQDARHYAPLVVRNAAVPMAGFGSSASGILLLLGVLFHAYPLLLLGVGLFAVMVVFQIINLPVEFNASARAKQQLVALGIVAPEQMVYVNNVLDAAAWTYVAATLQDLLTLLYYIFRFTSDRR